jgi:hypothetical protein
VDLYARIGSSTTKTTHLASAAALRSVPDTTPGLPDSTVGTATCDHSGYVSLDIGAATDSSGLPLQVALYQRSSVSDPESAWLQIGSGPGPKLLKHGPGVRHLVVQLKNTLGQSQVIFRDVTCP